MNIKKQKKTHLFCFSRILENTEDVRVMGKWNFDIAKEFPTEAKQPEAGETDGEIMDKLWTNYGQIMDKLWLITQNVLGLDWVETLLLSQKQPRDSGIFDSIQHNKEAGSFLLYLFL